MIDGFARLRMLVESAERGELSEARAAGSGTDLGLPIQQMLPQTAIQQQLPMQQMIQAPLAPIANMPAPSLVPDVVDPDLRPILEAIASGDGSAFERLRPHARTTIVEPAYARVQSVWDDEVRPTYLGALDSAADETRRIAEAAPETAAELAAALLGSADALVAAGKSLDGIEITPDNTIDDALGTDWWRTVAGKGAFADAVAASVDDQMRRIGETAAAPARAISEALALQQKLRDEVVARQAEIERQFAEQRGQLATLTGAASVVPIDLASFIGLYPLLLGLILGGLMFRAAQSRRQAAVAAADLAVSAPEDRATRDWLVRGALGWRDAVTPQLVTLALALGAAAWVAFASRQLADSQMNVPIAPWAGGLLAALIVIGAAAWDIVIIRRLAQHGPSA
jgi:hypothetical protein